MVPARAEGSDQTEQDTDSTARLCTTLPRAKHDAFTPRLLEICGAASVSSRCQADVLFIRDRLHERCAFFRLWPPRLQALVCQLATTK
jgi:hypothetical protein